MGSGANLGSETFYSEGTTKDMLSKVRDSDITELTYSTKE